MSFPEVKQAIAAGVHLPVLHRTTDKRVASSMDVSQMVFNRKICEWLWVVCCGWAASLGHHLFREYSGIYNGESAVEQKTGGVSCHYLNGSLMGPGLMTVLTDICNFHLFSSQKNTLAHHSFAPNHLGWSLLDQLFRGHSSTLLCSLYLLPLTQHRDGSVSSLPDTVQFPSPCPDRSEDASKKALISLRPLPGLQWLLLELAVLRDVKLGLWS